MIHQLSPYASRIGLAMILIGSIAFCETGSAAILRDTVSLTGKGLLIASTKTADYDRSSIFEYSDGAADMYLDGGFVTCSVRPYDLSIATKGSIEIVLYNMDSPLRALGLFATLCDGNTTASVNGIAVMSTVRRVVFCKRQWLFEVVDRSDTQLPSTQLTDIALSLSALVEGKQEVPREYAWLPTSGKVAGSQRYYHSNFLSRSYLRRTLTACYPCGAPLCTLFVSQQDSITAAQKAFEKFASSLYAQKSGDTLSSASVTAVVKGAFIIGTNGCAVREKALAIIRQCIALLP